MVEYAQRRNRVAAASSTFIMKLFMDRSFNQWRVYAACDKLSMRIDKNINPEITLSSETAQVNCKGFLIESLKVNAGRVWRGCAAKFGGACLGAARFRKHFCRRAHRHAEYVPI